MNFPNFLNASDIRKYMDIPYSDEQIAAIMHGNTPAVVIAGAGSGKTAVMAARVMHLVMNLGIAPEEILGLTFTNLATGELQERVRKALSKVPPELQSEFFKYQAEQVLVDKSADTLSEYIADAEFADPTVSTYHSFASSIVTEFGIRLGLEAGAEVISGPSRSQLAAEVLRNPIADVALLEGDFTKLLQAMISLDDAMADFDITVADLRVYHEKLSHNLNNRDIAPVAKIMNSIQVSSDRILLAELVEEFRQLKLQSSVIDYADMTRFALRLVREDEYVRTTLQKRFSAVLLDEYQDTSVAQRKLMQTLFSDNRPITAVGDPLQCIYRFRGASPANIDDFDKHFGHTEASPVYRFGMSFTQRNGKNIVALANRVAEPLRVAHTAVEPLRSVPAPKYGDGEIKAAITADLAAEMDWLAEQLKQEITAGKSPEDIAIILRRNVDVMEVYRQLTKRGLQCQVRSKWTLLEVAEVAEVVAYLRVIAEPTANSDWIRILTGPRFRIGDRDLKLIADVAAALTREVQLKRTSVTGLQEALDAATAETDSIALVAYGDAISEIAEKGSDVISAEAVDRIRLLNQEINHLRSFAMDGVAELVYKVMRITGLNIEVAATNHRLSRGMASNLRAFMRVVSSFNALGTSGTLFDFLDWLDAGDSYEAAPELPLVVHKGAVQLMTIHASKGLEYPVVALPRLFQDAFPLKLKPSFWHSNKTVIPFAIRDERIDEAIARFPIGNDSLRMKDEEAFKDAVRELDMLDERRMAYVAITRAKAKLLLSSSWLQPAETKIRDISPFFTEMLGELAEILPDFELDINAPKPDEVELEFDPITAEWPRRIEDQDYLAILDLAEQVRSGNDFKNSDALTEREQKLVSQWDAAIAGIVQEAEGLLAERVVELPANLSVSAIQRLQKDESEFLYQLIRPMPTPPSRAANIGTEFHAALERRFAAMAFRGYQSELELADVAEFSEEFESNPAKIEKFLQNFDNSEWADLVPAAFETAFTLELAGRSVFGRIDAVYAATDDPEYDWYVVDWKTNATANADPLQLALYRLAWAQIQGCAPDRIKAGFYYVALGQTDWPALPELAQITEQLS